MANIQVKQGSSVTNNKRQVLVRQKPNLNIGGKCKDLVWWADGPLIYCADENTDQIAIFTPMEIRERLEAERERINHISPDTRHFYSVTPEQQHAWLDSMILEVLVPAWTAFKEEVTNMGLVQPETDKPKLIIPDNKYESS